ncbi:hypothetical protein [Edaphobacter modestus]|uniref:Uncharacterized protein n=1 Tax=Edaphobacter modestus TaxID=388466 RepID=A0A4Q7YZJ8_9BACT|nr:hypothetical protein [Edaphobacter modestus]RZU42711.1 hypothetical protein BDD14_4303 [Edaphobacter modestus]
MNVGLMIEITKAVALFAWPALIFYLTLTFRSELRTLLGVLPGALNRVRGADVLGIKLELAELRETSSEAQSQVLSIQTSVTSKEHKQLREPQIEDDPVARIRERAVVSPEAGVLLTSVYIEREIKEIVASSGLLSSYTSPQQGLKLLRERELMPAALAESLDKFMTIRTMIVHTDADPALTTEALSQGLVLLTMLRSIHRSSYEVVRTDVTLYSDPDGKVVVPDAKGVVLRARDQHGRPSASTQIHPTTRQMFVGTKVSWEWNLGKTWRETWFRDPDSQELFYAWSNSAEFVGMT